MGAPLELRMCTSKFYKFRIILGPIVDGKIDSSKMPGKQGNVSSIIGSMHLYSPSCLPGIFIYYVTESIFASNIGPLLNTSFLLIRFTTCQSSYKFVIQFYRSNTRIGNGIGKLRTVTFACWHMFFCHRKVCRKFLHHIKGVGNGLNH